MIGKKLLEVARKVVKENMGLYYNERAYIITDRGSRQRAAIAKALLKASKEIASDSFMEVMPETGGDGTEPPEEISHNMLDADILLMPTTYSLSHTAARKAASGMGVRWASMPHITKDMFLRTLSLDYRAEVVPVTNYVARKVRHAERVKIRTAAGTDFTVYRTGRTVHEDNGIYTGKGSGGNLPAGEAFFAPNEGKSYGKIVVDGGISQMGKLKEPLTIEVEGGMVKSLSGSRADELKRILMPEKLGDKVYNIAELGIGTNKQAVGFETALEGEKILGTCHVALGNNTGFGGGVSVPLHIDMVIKNPTISFESGFVLMENGALQGFQELAASSV
ncbi:MAG: aminopeptidase [archaeon]